MKKRFLSMFLAIVMVVGMLPGFTLTVSAAGETSGTTGDVNWSYDTETKTLTISGTGEMGTDTPWRSEYKSQIQTIVITSGVTRIGNSAFSGCSALTKVEIADTVTAIDAHAFNGCSILKHITIPASVTSIGAYAFSNCTALETVTYLGKSSPSGYGSSLNDPFSNVTNVMIIVPDSYTGTKFCETTVTKESDVPAEPDNLSLVYVGGIQLALDTNYINDNNGVKISDNNTYNVKVTGNDIDGYTLTLSGANITGITDNTANAYQSSGIISKLNELTIVVEEDSTITGADSTNAHSAGIYSIGKVIISGSGKLTAIGGSSTVRGGVSSGILANELVINNAKVDAIGGTTGTEGTPTSAGFGGAGDMSVTINGVNADVTATGNKYGAILYQGSLNVSGGKFTAEAKANTALYVRGTAILDSGEIIAQTVEGQTAINRSYATTVEGKTIRYTFADNTSTTVWDSNTVLKHSYIKLTVDNPDPIYHTITFITNGGKLTGDGITEVETNSKYTMQYEEGKGATLPRTITREGYVFVGWRDNSNLTGSNYGSLGTGANYDFTYYAKWDPAYTVTVVSGTGDGVYKEGTTVTITADAPEAGKMFAGWASEDGVSFADSKSAETTFTMPAKAVTVTAIYADLLPGKVIVNGVDLVNGEDDHAIDCGDGTAVYDPATQTLTLTNATITTDAGQAYAYSGIYAAGLTGELKIVLIGENSITLTDENKQNTGIMIPGGTQLGNFDLAISGPDPYNLSSLTMTLYDANVPSGIDYAGLGDLSISQVDLTINLTEDSTADNDAAIHSNNDITIENASITINDFWMGLSSATGVISIIDSDVRISAFGQAIYTEGAIEIEEGSNVRVTSENYGAITGWSDVNITLSDVEAKSVYSNGIYVYGHLTISDSVVEAYSEEWDALCAIGGMTVTNNSEVIAEGEYTGIYTNDTLTVESGTVEAVGRSDIAILAQRISDNPEDSKPTESPVAIVLMDGLIEASGSVITTDDWRYTEVWDDWNYDYVWMWMSQSYFTDEDGDFFTEANVIPGYTVVYVPGTNGTGDANSAVKAKGTPLTLKDAIYTRTGYTQTGWATTDGGEKVYDLGAEYTVEANAVLYPFWTADQYTITFDTDGGTVIDSITQDYNTAVEMPDDPTKTGFDFGGWYADSGLTSSYVFGTMPAANITVYAKWNPATGTAYTVKHYHQNASGSGYTLYESETLRGTTNADTAAEAKNYPGFTALAFAQTTILADGSAVVEIKYNRNTYSVTLVTNGGIIRDGDVTGYVYGVGAKLPTNVTRSSYYFGGWYDNEDCKGTPVTVITATDIGDKIFYAKWDVDITPFLPLLIKYDVDVTDGIIGGTVTTDKSSASVNDKVNVTVVPTEGYTIQTVIVTDAKGNAVTVNVNGEGKYSFKMPMRDVTVYAVFDKTEVPVTPTTCPRDYTCPMYPFTDLELGAWYHDGVHFVIENGLMGSTNTDKLTFEPSATTTRAMIVTILWRLEGSPVVNYAMDFEDVAADQWYTEAIRWAASEKIVEGYGDKFGPSDAITREQLATIMWRYAKHKGYDVSVGENTNILSYGDAFDVAEWAIPAMQWACGSGLIQGIADGNTMNLEPQGNATRAQAATILYRFCEVSGKEE